MVAMFRLMFIGFLVLSVVYLALSFYARTGKRRALQDEFAESGAAGDAEAFVQRGLQDYEKRLRRKLILGVYVVPLGVVALMIYLTNFH